MMISSEEAGVELHISSSRVIERDDMPNIFVVVATFNSNNAFATVPAARMLGKCNDWELDGIEINGASKLNLLKIEALPSRKDPYYKVAQQYRFEFELLTRADVNRRKKKNDSQTHLRTFTNLITDDV